MKTGKLLSLLLTAALLLSLFTGLGVTALADDGNLTGVTYLDENGNSQTYTGGYKPIDETELPKSWTDGWYVVDGADLRLSNVTVTGDVHLILKDGCSLTVCGSDSEVFHFNATISVTAGNSLTIYAQSDGENMGALTIPKYTGSIGAGIGGCNGDTDDTDNDCGAVTINGGNITAIGGGYGSAGIGGGTNGAGGTITINGGIVTATGTNGGAGIGGGEGGAGGNIAINGGSITATGTEGGAAIGAGSSGNGGSVTLGAGRMLADADSGDPIFDWQAAIAVSDTALKFRVVPLIPVTYLDAEGKPQTCTDYTAVSCTVPVWGAEGEETWYVAGGTVELNSVTVLGDVHLILMDGCKLTVNDGGKKANPGGILVASNNSLTVYAQSDAENMGALTSYGSSNRAGIGGRSASSGGSGAVTINGGNIIAKGGNSGAGIGGGTNGDGGNITINGGSVTAKGKNGGAGIGGGETNESIGGDSGAGGNITITGGTIKASGSSGGAGVGGGNYGDGGTIAISGGSVNATGFAGGAGVGGGKNGAGGTVIISGGSVNATGAYGAGIGSGSGGAGGAVAISGGSITVYGSNGGAAIGSGANITEPVAVTLGAGLTLADADSGDPFFDWQAAIAVSGKTLKFKVIRLDPVTYLDADGAEQECTTYRTVSAETLPTAWSTGWYVADGTGLNLSDVTVSGDVNLILTDSCDLTATGSDGNPGIRVEGDSSLTIFAQSDGENMGRLTATGKEGAGIGGESASGGSITINGGSITATGGTLGAGIGGGTITLNGGSITATGGTLGAGIGGGTITLNGGSITATGGDGGAGIGGGNITLNGGSITATGTEGGAGIGNGANVTIPAAVTLAAGKALMDADGGLIADWQTDIAKSDTTVSFTVVTAPVFTSTSLTLGNEIGLNFYMNIPEDCAGGTVSATVGGVEIPADKITNPADGKYSVPLNVLQMADTVVLTYTYDGGKKSVSREYSAERYLKLAQRKATGDALVSLINATYAYGYYSQQFLSEAHGFTLGEAYAALENGGSIPDVVAAAAALENYALSVTGESENVTDVKLSLRMDAKTTLRVYFAANVTPTVTLKKGGELDVQYDADKELYYVDVASLSAHQLGNTYTLNADGKTVTVSALAYCNQVMKADTSYTYDKQFAAAIYEYYTAVIAYRAG